MRRQPGAPLRGVSPQPGESGRLPSTLSAATFRWLRTWAVPGVIHRAMSAARVLTRCAIVVQCGSLLRGQVDRKQPELSVDVFTAGHEGTRRRDIRRTHSLGSQSHEPSSTSISTSRAAGTLPGAMFDANAR